MHYIRRGKIQLTGDASNNFYNTELVNNNFHYTPNFDRINFKDKL